MSEQGNIVIVAPHPDDECIGCFTVLTDEEVMNNIFIVYSNSVDPARRLEALTLKSKFKSIAAQFFSESIPPPLLDPKNTFYFPDPVYENHPLHRKYGTFGEQLLRSGLNVIFYTVNMQTPYIFEIKNPEKKKELLDEIYPSQRDLWIDNKYFLFEGYCKWLLKGR